MYDYNEVIKDDIRTYINDEIEIKEEIEETIKNGEDMEDIYEKLYDILFAEDSVTGNASGSYTFSSLEAMECVTDNMDELNKAIEEFGVSNEEVGEKFLNGDWEYFDVTIRCAKLSNALTEVLDEMEEELS